MSYTSQLQLQVSKCKFTFVGNMLISILLILILSSVGNGATLQKIKFYELENKGGTSQEFTQGRDFNVDSFPYNARSFCVELGLWKIKYLDINNTEKVLPVGGNSVGETCVNSAEEANQRFIRIDPVGELDLEISSLSLFSRSNFIGEELKVADSSILPTSSRYFSYVLTGTQHYQIFSEAEFEGESTCLYANGGAGSSLDYGIVSKYNTLIVLRSARRGCPTNPGGGGSPSPGLTTTPSGVSSITSESSTTLILLSHFIHLALLLVLRKIIF